MRMENTMNASTENLGHFAHSYTKSELLTASAVQLETLRFHGNTGRSVATSYRFIIGIGPHPYELPRTLGGELLPCWWCICASTDTSTKREG
jgi:hypothetical protein